MSLALADLQNSAARAEDVLAISTSIADLKADIEKRFSLSFATLSEKGTQLAALEVSVLDGVERLHKQDERIDHLAARPASPSRLPEAVLGTLRAVAMVLAARFLIVMALAGTFVLALMAMQNQTPTGVYLTVAFALLTLAPLVFMEVRQRPPVS